MSCNCQTPFSDSVTAGVTTILVNGVLTPTTDFLWEITDRFGNIYLIPFTTDENGKGEIDVSLLPAGFLNAAIGGFQVRVKTTPDACDYEKMIMAVNYTTLSVDVVTSSLPKTKIGCDVSFPVSPGLSAKSLVFTISAGQAGPTFAISEATSSLAVLRNGVVDETWGFDPNTHTWTFSNPLLEGDVVRFIYNRT